MQLKKFIKIIYGHMIIQTRHLSAFLCDTLFNKLGLFLRNYYIYSHRALWTFYVAQNVGCKKSAIPCMTLIEKMFAEKNAVIKYSTVYDVTYFIAGTL